MTLLGTYLGVEIQKLDRVSLLTKRLNVFKDWVQKLTLRGIKTFTS